MVCAKQLSRSLDHSKSQEYNCNAWKSQDQKVTMIRHQIQTVLDKSSQASNEEPSMNPYTQQAELSTSSFAVTSIAAVPGPLVTATAAVTMITILIPGIL